MYSRLNTKGSAFIGTSDYFAQTFGPGCMDEIKAALSREDHDELFSKPVLPVSWIDYPAYLRFLIAADKALGRGDFALAKDAVLYETHKSFRGVYKMIFTFHSPGAAVSGAAQAWRTFMSAGKLEVVEKRDHFAHGRLVDCPGIPRHHEIDHGTTMTEVIVMAGGRNVRFEHPRCIGRGDPYWEMILTWE